MYLDKCYQTEPSLQVSVENNALSTAICGGNKISAIILYQFFNYHAIYGDNIHVSQQTIANKAGCSLREVSRQMAQLHKDGLIEKIRSKINKFAVCRYKVTELALEQKPRILSWYKFFKGLAFAAGISFTPISVGPRVGVLYCLKDITYTKTVAEQPENLFLKVYSIYSEATKRREYPPAHHWPTESRESRRKERPPTKKESTMEQPAWITPTLNAATKALNLTKWGQIRLSAYPDQSILHALTVFKGSKSAKNDLFKWFSSVCNEWCKKNNKAPDWALMHRLATENEMPDDPMLVMPTKPLEIPKAKAKTESGLMDKVVQELRQKNRDRIALNLPEDIERERAYLAANPDWLDWGRRLGADMSRWGLKDSDIGVVESVEEKVVTELKDQIVCAQIANDEAVWDNLTYSPVDGDMIFEEVMD